MKQTKKQSRNDYMKSYRAKQKAQDNESTKILRELEASYRKHRQRIEAAMDKASPGTQVWLRYAEALAKLDAQRRAELVERGYAPANLSIGTTPGFVFTATVARGGAITVHQENPAERARVIAALEEEFPSDVPISRREDEE